MDQPVTSPQTAPQAQPEAQVTTQAQTPAPATQDATPAAPQVSLRDSLKPLLGDVVTQFQDDEAALHNLALAYKQSQQYQQYAPYLQQYLAHADKFGAYMKEQQAAEQKEQAAKQQWFKAPEYDPAWADKISQDPTTGQWRVKDGYSPDIVNKFLTAVEHQRGFLNKFAFDPIGAIRPGVEQVAAQVAQQLIQQHLGGYRDEVFARNFVDTNSQWLHQRDAAGNVVYNQATRMPELSDDGRRFRDYVLHAQNTLGIGDVHAQQQYALGMVQRDYAIAQLTSQGAQAAGAQAKHNFLAQAAGTPAQPTGVTRTAAAAELEGDASGGGTSKLQRMLKAKFKENGFQVGEPVPS